MRFTWKGRWRKGEITLEAESMEELTKELDKLSIVEETQPSPIMNSSKDFPIVDVREIEIPPIPSGTGATQAIRTLLDSEWGKQPRTMKEIEDALQSNALYFSKGTLSGTLNMMTKGNSLRRFQKAGTWVYVIR
jgi:hypothetical protein